MPSRSTGRRTRQSGHQPDRIPREVIAEEEGRPLYLYGTDSPLRSMSGDLGRLAMFAGQSCGEVNTVEAAGNAVRRIVNEATATLARRLVNDAGPLSRLHQLQNVSRRKNSVGVCRRRAMRRSRAFDGGI